MQNISCWLAATLTRVAEAALMKPTLELVLQAMKWTSSSMLARHKRHHNSLIIKLTTLTVYIFC